MSTFTTELRYVLESMCGYTENQPASKVNDVIDQARTSLFNFDYPCSNLTTSEKEHLEKHIMLHFYFKEIGFETVGLFKTKLQSKMWDIMPKYNKLYEIEHLDIDFFNDVDYTRKLDSTIDRDGTDTKTGSISDQNSGYDETATTGKIINQNSGAITDVKTGSETTANTGYTEAVQTGSIVDDGGHTNTRTESGSYADTESGSISKVTTGSYTDENTGNVKNLSSDTPQSNVDISSNDYVSSIDKRIDDTQSERTYNNLTETTTPTNHKNERTFNNYKVEDVNTNGNERTFNNVKTRDTDNTESETTFNNVTNVSTDTKKSEQTFDDYKVRNTDAKAHTQTFNNLMNTIDNTDITDLTERIFGNVSGNNIKKLVDYRDSVINLELMIIKDLKPLFMGLFM